MTTASADPYSIPQHSPGAKLDSGKQLPFTVLGAFSPALLEVTKVGTFGAEKYTKHGWIAVPHGKERYYEAMMRHLLEDMKMPESKDPETGISHLSHAAWNILAILSLRVREQECKVPPTAEQKKGIPHPASNFVQQFQERLNERINPSI